MSTNPVLSMSIAPSPDVRATVVDQTLILVNMKSGQYYGLNEMGQRIWQMLSDGLAGDAIVSTIANEYDGAQDVIIADTCTILADLLNAGLAEAITR